MVVQRPCHGIADLKNIPPALLRSLHRAAERDRRSVTQQALYLLESSQRGRAEAPVAAQLRESAVPSEAFKAAQLAAWRKLAGTWQSDLEPAVEAEQIMAARTSSRRKVDL